MSQDSETFVSDGPMMNLVVSARTVIARDIVRFDFARDDGLPLPEFSAGAHVTVLTPNGLTRRYSLCNDPADRSVYQIAVKRDPLGMGGSINLVDTVRPGMSLPVSRPSNYFTLDHTARSHLLIAGGIGITPVLSMVRELQNRGAEFRVIYLCRDKESAAFIEQLGADDLKGKVQVHYSQATNTGKDNSEPFNLEHLMSEQPEQGHVYCCGPRRLMQAVKEYAHKWPAHTIHFEDFGTSEQPGAKQDSPFKVRLAKSGQLVDVPCGISILEALRREKISMPSSCESGTCGACRTPLVSGKADHRDYVLDDDEHDHVIMICVSRAISEVLEIDV